jgi:hypothetical protein
MEKQFNLGLSVAEVVGMLTKNPGKPFVVRQQENKNYTRFDVIPYPSEPFDIAESSVGQIPQFLGQSLKDLDLDMEFLKCPGNSTKPKPSPKSKASQTAKPEVNPLPRTFAGAFEVPKELVDWLGLRPYQAVHLRCIGENQFLINKDVTDRNEYVQTYVGTDGRLRFGVTRLDAVCKHPDSKSQFWYHSTQEKQYCVSRNGTTRNSLLLKIL